MLVEHADIFLKKESVIMIAQNKEVVVVVLQIKLLQIHLNKIAKHQHVTNIWATISSKNLKLAF